MKKQKIKNKKLYSDIIFYKKYKKSVYQLLTKVVNKVRKDKYIITKTFETNKLILKLTSKTITFNNGIPAYSEFITNIENESIKLITNNVEIGFVYAYNSIEAKHFYDNMKKFYDKCLKDLNDIINDSNDLYR